MIFILKKDEKNKFHKLFLLEIPSKKYYNQVVESVFNNGI
ncbi:hypothetical protein SRA_06256 [Streptococcus ratti FA-1 = DSM 20564]|uniref:Uncharacterized protein n=1 Tax=Streptococcus ratti FA-1 = DSM 20564 TaxID=699248 RepID=A0ABP2QYQ4_STRRT|nr:hypothetical protein SRA_06256 [Streptococcus ratti FA-1 = DSM 20564]